MKKLTLILISLAMAITLFSACDTTDNDVNDPSNKETTTLAGGTTTTAKSEPISFTELTVVDNDECTIKITELDPNNLFGYAVNVQLANKSSDKTYMFSVNDAAINGVVCTPLFANEVAPEKKSNSSVYFTEDLTEYGIGDYTDIELTFRVYDSDNWEADNVAKETVHIYPYGQDKATTFSRAPQDSDIVLVDNDELSVTVIGYDKDNIWGYSVNVFIQNKTDKNIMFSTDNESINGFMVSALWAETVPSGKCSFGSITWFSSSLEDNNITTVENIEFILRAYDADNYFADDIVNKEIKLVP